jgi:hypothetical protein
MRTLFMRTLLLGMATFAVATLMNAEARAEVKLEPIDFEKLEKAIVQMHKELGKDGLVVVSLTIDELEDRGKALEFLKEKGAEFENFILNDTEANKEKWDKKWSHSAPPIAWVFDREGKLSKIFEGDKQTDMVEGYVKELLKK